MPVDPPFTVYRDQLSAPSHGLALWHPNPPKTIYNNVSVGDVGYLHEGMFIRMFNVMLPWDHPSNAVLGEPEPYDPLGRDHTHMIRFSNFGQVVHCSCFVTAQTNAGNLQAMTRDE